MHSDVKKTAALILDQDEPPEKSGDELPISPTVGPAEEGLGLAAGDLIDAVHSKDRKGVISALRAAMEMMHGGEEHAEEEP